MKDNEHNVVIELQLHLHPCYCILSLKQSKFNLTRINPIKNPNVALWETPRKFLNGHYIRNCDGIYCWVTGTSLRKSMRRKKVQDIGVPQEKVGIFGGIFLFKNEKVIYFF